MTAIDIVSEESDEGGRYAATIAGRAGEVELTWHHSRLGVVSADHTFAPDSMRGTGAAAALVQRLVDDARAKGRRIVPDCPYVRAQFARHPEWADLRGDI